MKVVIINCVYPPEPVVSAQMGQDLAVHLAKSGVQVTVLCPFPSRPFGAKYPKYLPATTPQIRREDCIEVVRLPSFREPQSRLLSRTWESFSFAYAACSWLKKRAEKADVIYANTMPLVGPILIARYCNRFDIPLVWHIKDLYPESLRSKLPDWVYSSVFSTLVKVDRWSAHRASHTVVLSDSIRKVYLDSRGLPAERLTTILDWVDEKRFENPPTRAEACAKYGVEPSKFTFLYLGNVGPVAGVEFLIKTFYAANIPNSQLVVAGDGSAKASCVNLVKRLGAANICFVSDSEAANVPLMQSLGHVCLLPLRVGAGLSSIPSKLMAYLLSGRPVLATLDLDSDTARCINDAGCGWVGPPEQESWLISKMREVAFMPVPVLEAIGQEGRHYGLRHFSKAAGVQRLGDILVRTASLTKSSVESGSTRILGEPTEN